MNSAAGQPYRVESIHAIDPAAWNQYCADNPFINWHFFAALEDSGACVNDSGWQPHHWRMDDANGQFRAALPCYLKNHSHGDYVYDWGWARALASAGLNWYPKLVTAVPYSPVTCRRLLCANDDSAAADALLAAMRETCDSNDYTTAQVLFPTPAEHDCLERNGFILRRDWLQFHWHNRGYSEFADFLAVMRHKKRKRIRQERQRLHQAGYHCRWVDAATASADEHALAHRCYTRTFRQYGNLPVLNADFFIQLGAAQPGRLWYCIASDSQHCDLASAIYLRSDEVLYGRYWGALEDIPGMHFEVCYYQGIEFCLQHGLKRFEPGVQGEHKVSRGFLPAASYSAHYFSHPQVARAARQWLNDEQDWMSRYRQEILLHSPYHPEVTDDLLAIG
ncbi:MAG: GNAT family N-acetyltransferase [Wenzhouxiangellaceae bacterium]